MHSGSDDSDSARASARKLEHAVENGDLPLISKLLAKGGNPDGLSARYGCLITLAIFKSQIESMQVLLKAGANPNASSEDGGSAISLAAGFGRVDMAQILHHHGASLEPTPASLFGLAVHEAVGGQHVHMLRWLLEHGARVDHFNFSGFTPLMLAAKLGHADCVRICLSFGAHPDVRSFSDGSTAAMCALYSEPGVMSALCAHGFDVLVRNKSGSTVSALAAWNPTAPGSLVFAAWRLSRAEHRAVSKTVQPKSSVPPKAARL